MAGFNEGKTERKFFFVILLCGIGGGWFSDFLAQRYRFGEWLGVLLGIVLTAFLFVTALIVIVRWEERNESQSEQNVPRSGERK